MIYGEGRSVVDHHQIAWAIAMLHAGRSLAPEKAAIIPGGSGAQVRFLPLSPFEV